MIANPNDLIAFLSVLFLASIIWQGIHTIRKGEGFVEGEVIGFKIVKDRWFFKLLNSESLNTIIKYTAKDGTQSQTQAVYTNLLKPEGHRVTIWVSNGKCDPYFIMRTAFILALSCWLIMIMSLSWPRAIETILFWLGPLIFLSGIIINIKLLNSLPFVISKRPDKKLTKQEYKEIIDTDGLLTYEDAVRLHYYGLTSMPMYLFVLIGLVFTSWLVYTNWQNLD